MSEEKTLGKVARDAWYRVRPSCPADWQAVADAVVAAHEARRWKAIESAPKDGGKTWILGRGKYAHPFDPAMNEDVVAQIYFHRIFHEWIDAQGQHFTPTHWTPIPAPPKEAE